MGFTVEDVYRLVHEVRGKQDVDDMRAALDKEIQTLRELSAQLGATDPKVIAAGVAAQATAAKVLDAEEALRSIPQSSTRAAQGMLQLGYAVDDLQYGLRAIVNNIPQLALAFGGANAAALAGGLGIAAVAVSQLVSHWDQLTEALGFSATGDEAQRMEALANQTHKTAEETATLNKYKREQAEIERLMGLKSEEKRAAAAAFEKAIGEVDGEKLVKGLVETRITAGGGYEGMMSQEQQEYIGKIRRQMEGATPAERKQSEEVIQRIVQGEKDRILEEQTKRARKDIERAGEQPEMLTALINQIKAAPGAFPTGAAEQLAEATPEGMAAEAEDEARQERLGKLGATRQRIRQRRQEQNRRLTEEGKLGEKESKRTAPELWKTPAQKKAAQVQAAKTAKEVEIGELEVQATELGGFGPGMARTVAEHAYKLIHDFDMNAVQALAMGAARADKAEVAGLAGAARGAARAEKSAYLEQKSAEIQQGYGLTKPQADLAAKKAISLMAKSNMTEAQAGQAAVMELNAEVAQLSHHLQAISNGHQQVVRQSRMRQGHWRNR